MSLTVFRPQLLKDCLIVSCHLAGAGIQNISIPISFDLQPTSCSCPPDLTSNPVVSVAYEYLSRTLLYHGRLFPREHILKASGLYIAHFNMHIIIALHYIPSGLLRPEEF